jgi:hypothetical protein
MPHLDARNDACLRHFGAASMDVRGASRACDRAKIAGARPQHPDLHGVNDVAQGIAYKRIRAGAVLAM